jgi:hypothetical protein
VFPEFSRYDLVPVVRAETIPFVKRVDPARVSLPILLRELAEYAITHHVCVIITRLDWFLAYGSYYSGAVYNNGEKPMLCSKMSDPNAQKGDWNIGLYFVSADAFVLKNIPEYVLRDAWTGKHIAVDRLEMLENVPFGTRTSLAYSTFKRKTGVYNIACLTGAMLFTQYDDEAIRRKGEVLDDVATAHMKGRRERFLRLYLNDDSANVNARSHARLWDAFWSFRHHVQHERFPMNGVEAFRLFYRNGITDFAEYGNTCGLSRQARFRDGSGHYHDPTDYIDVTVSGLDMALSHSTFGVRWTNSDVLTLNWPQSLVRCFEPTTRLVVSFDWRGNKVTWQCPKECLLIPHFDGTMRVYRWWNTSSMVDLTRLLLERVAHIARRLATDVGASPIPLYDLVFPAMHWWHLVYLQPANTPEALTFVLALKSTCLIANNRFPKIFMKGSLSEACVSVDQLYSALWNWANAARTSTCRVLNLLGTH